MGKNNVTFGFTTQAARPQGAASAKEGTASFQELMAGNEQFIAALQPPFDTVWVEDHLQWGDRPMIECWTTLTYLAAKYPHLKFGNIVLGQSYRNAALTAKMAATLQALTGGRFILGLGAGWKEDEYRAYGYDYPSTSVRIEQLEDACQIVKAMFTTSPATFHGKHYNIENAYCEPRPDPIIPLLIGASGEKKTLRIVAQYADWWNINFCPAEEMAHKQQVLREHCIAVGRNYDEIKQTYYGFLQIADDPAEIHHRSDLHMIAGNPEQVAAEVQQFINLGVSHIMFRFIGFPKLDSLTRFVDEVLPRLEIGQ